MSIYTKIKYPGMVKTGDLTSPDTSCYTSRMNNQTDHTYEEVEEIYPGGKLIFMNIDDIKFDPLIQRGAGECISHRKKIQGKWEDSLCEPVHVNRRSNGFNSCFDGQNRCMMQKNMGREKIWAWYIEGLSFSEEASRFISLNENRKAVSPVDTFKNRINCNEPDALEIRNILNKYGIVISKNSKKKYSTTAVQTFRGLYQMGILEDTLHVVESCWGGGEDLAEKDFLNSYFLRGLGQHLNCLYYNEGHKKVRPNADVLIEAIKTNKQLNPERILRKAASGSAVNTGAGFWGAVADTFMDIHNRKYRGDNRLVRPVNSRKGK